MGVGIDYADAMSTWNASVPDDPGENLRLLRQAAAGDEASWRALLARHHRRLHRMIALRFDQRVQGRASPSDVIQETYLQAWSSLADYLRQTEIPFYLWLRGIAGNKLRELHRRHLGAQMRNARREISLDQGPCPEVSSAALAAQLVGRLARPSEAADRAEMNVRLQKALEGLEPLDREVLTLRHFEQLTPAQTAQVLGIREKAAGMRYVRAVRRLKDVLLSLPGGPWELYP
jgi:RNA polymerase sigma-70 factor, ECF subfamily